MKHYRVTLAVAATLIAASSAANCRGQAEQPADLIKINRPGDREFVLDEANLISAADKKHIQELCDQLLTEKATPIIVVTINSMAEHGGGNMSIESFATLLFNQWQIGVKEVNNQQWNTGILLLVSKYDRKARIELGGYWRRDQDALAKKLWTNRSSPNSRPAIFRLGSLRESRASTKWPAACNFPKRPRRLRRGGSCR